MKSNGTLYYAYLVVYVDDIICVEEDRKKILRRLWTKYKAFFD